MNAPLLRPLDGADSIAALTALLHRAYAPLGAAGLNFTAVDQSEQTTRKRTAEGDCLVLDDGGVLIGSVVVALPGEVMRTPWFRVSPWYLRRDTAHLNQLAIEPALQGRGLGRRLIEAAEAWALERGWRVMALDTAEPASHLRRYYARLGYTEVDAVQWQGKRYRSLILAKALDGGPLPADDDAEHRCARLQAYWGHVQARDWPAVRAALADDAVLDWPVSGERFEGADTIVRVNAEYPEGWAIEVRSLQGLADGGTLSVVEVPHGERRFHAVTRCRWAGARLAALVEHWATAEDPPVWRCAQSLGPGYRRLAAQERTR